MKLNGKEVLVCNCEGTMTIDGKALAKACQGSDKKGGGKKAEAEVAAARSALAALSGQA